MATTITPFTTTPSRANPTTFSADMDTRLTQENSRIAEMNLQSGENNVINANVNTKEVLADNYANLLNTTVETGKWSAKEFAIGDLTVNGGSAKAWATDIASPDGTTSKSAKTLAAEALVSAGNAATSESNAAISATNAHNSELATAALLDSFDDRYLGSKAVEPTLDNDGNALVSGALYFNTVTNNMKVYDSITPVWIALSFVPTDHGALTGLADDDHPQYHNDARGDVRYYTKSANDVLLNAKQDTLVSGTNLKSINGGSLLGSGDISISSAIKEYVGAYSTICPYSKYSLDSTIVSLATNAGTLVQAQNTCNYIPFVLDEDITITKLILYVRANVAGATGILGIYASSANAPTSLIISSTTLDFSATGLKSSTISQTTLLKNTLYFYAVNASSTSVKTNAPILNISNGRDMASSNTYKLHSQSIGTVSLPATATPSLGNCPSYAFPELFIGV